MVDWVKVENVFYCPGDEVAYTSAAEVKVCNVCGELAMKIGFFESDGRAS